MNAPGISAARCAIPSPDVGSAGWNESRQHLIDAFQQHGPDGAAARADDFLHRHADAGDLRALGFCRQCGAQITLRQVGRCVYSVPCDHYRAQGDLKRILRALAARAEKITPERQAALLALIGR